MILNEYRKISLVLSLLGCILIFILTRNIILVVCFLLGAIVSNLNFVINEKFFVLEASKQALTKNLSNYFLRILLYALVMVLSFKLGDLQGLILCFIGCLLIRLSILIHAVKEVISKWIFLITISTHYHNK